MSKHPGQKQFLQFVLAAGCLLAGTTALAAPFFFSTGNPDGLIGTFSGPAGPGVLETETADDFVLTQSTSITQATIIGLIPVGAPLTNISNVEVEIYHVFPTDSTNPPSGNVLTRVNSPADVEIASATRDGIAATLSFTPAVVSPSFAVNNTVVNGINKFPNQFTGGDLGTTGQEVQITITFTTPIDLAADHYFFRPEVELTSGDFLWLSAPKPIIPPGTPFPAGANDLQSWIRNSALNPDWSRIGTDITHQGPFNATFSLTGQTIPEPGTLALLGLAFAGMSWARQRKVH